MTYLKTKWTTYHPEYRTLFGKIKVPNWDWNEIMRDYLKVVIPISYLLFFIGLFFGFETAFFGAGVGFIGSSFSAVLIFFVIVKFG